VSFNPSELTVKSARELLDDLNIEDLKEVLQAELDGKHRSSLIADIGRAIDALKTSEEAAPAKKVAPAKAAVAPKVAKRRIHHGEWERLPRHKRALFVCVGDSLYESV